MSSTAVVQNTTSREIGHYNIKEVIGKGSFATVHRGIDNRNSTEVAVKIVDKSKCTIDDLQRLKTEIKIMSSLRHKNIVQLLDILETHDHVFLILQYCNGGDLLRYINNHGALSEMMAASVLIQLLRALEYAHSQGFIHRDVKLENIFIHNGKILLGDWGLAGSYSLHTMQNADMGSLRYCAPEIVRGDYYYGPEVDIWSCGVILYAIVTAKLPFNGRTSDIKQQTCNGAYNMPQSTSLSFQHLLATMLCVDRKHRATVSQIKCSTWLQSYYNQFKDNHLINNNKGSTTQLLTPGMSRNKINAPCNKTEQKNSPFNERLAGLRRKPLSQSR